MCIFQLCIISKVILHELQRIGDCYTRLSVVIQGDEAIQGTSLRHHQASLLMPIVIILEHFYRCRLFS